MNSLIAQHVRLLSVQHHRSLRILDSGAGISGVGDQWKMSDISASSEVTIQGAFGDPMKPTVQGLLGPDKLQAVLVPGIKMTYILSVNFSSPISGLAQQPK